MVKNEIGYSGQVKVTAMRGKKAIRTATFHNEGTINLFKFLCYCLAGEYNVAYNLRPQKIQLFFNQAGTYTEDLNNLKERSGKIQLNTDAVVKKYEPKSPGETDTNKYTVTLHFRIPYAFLTGDEVNHAILYNAYDEPCAHFSFTDEETGALINILTGANQDYTLVIEWKMIVGNQKGDN